MQNQRNSIVLAETIRSFERCRIVTIVQMISKNAEEWCVGCPRVRSPKSVVAPGPRGRPARVLLPARLRLPHAVGAGELPLRLRGVPRGDPAAASRRRPRALRPAPLGARFVPV